MASLFETGRTANTDEATRFILNNIRRWYRGERDIEQVVDDFWTLNRKVEAGESLDDLESKRWTWFQRAGRTGIDSDTGRPYISHQDGQVEYTDEVAPMPGSFWPDGQSMNINPTDNPFLGRMLA